MTSNVLQKSKYPIIHLDIDPLYSDVTLREHLEVYAAIKGIHPDDIKRITEE